MTGSRVAYLTHPTIMAIMLRLRLPWRADWAPRPNGSSGLSSGTLLKERDETRRICSVATSPSCRWPGYEPLFIDTSILIACFRQAQAVRKHLIPVDLVTSTVAIGELCYAMYRAGNQLPRPRQLPQEFLARFRRRQDEPVVFVLSETDRIADRQCQGGSSYPIQLASTPIWRQTVATFAAEEVP
jgi:hypothetical protein